MNHQQAFLDAICADPDDMTLRLVYADWLDENGQPERGEFIRVQCRLAELNAELMSAEDCGHFYCPGCVERRHLQHRVGELLRQGYFAWSPLDAKFHKQHHQALTYRCGFVESVTLPCSAWLQHGPALVKATPLREVRLSDKEPMNDNRMYEVWLSESRESWIDALIIEDAVPSRNCLPDAIFRLLTGHRMMSSAVASYELDQGQPALSRACLDYAHGRKSDPSRTAQSYSEAREMREVVQEVFNDPSDLLPRGD